MIDAIVGAVIMVVATTSLFLAIEVAEDAFRSAGRYPLNEDEQVLLDSLTGSLRELNRDSDDSLKKIENVEVQITEKLYTQYQEVNGI